MTGVAASAIEITEVAIAGGGMTPFNRRKDKSSYRDWASSAFVHAVQDSGVAPSDIDALVVASESDFFTAQLNPSALLADHLGLHGIQTYRAEGGGATGHLAVQIGATLVRSGQAKRVAVLGVEASASHLSGDTVSHLYNLSYDSWFEGQQPINSTAIYALSANAYQAQRGATEMDFASVAVANRTHAMGNKNAHLPLNTTIDDVLNSPIIATPYHRLDCSPLSDGASCLILTYGGDVDTKNPHVSVAGMAVANDRVRLGDRANPAQFDAKQTAAKRAYAMANITPQDVSLVELYDSYSGAQLQGLEALGLTDDAVVAQRNGIFTLDNGFAVNVSGGLLGQGAPVGAVGVAQFLTVYKILMGEYWGVCPHWDSPYGLVDTHGGIATTCAVSVLQRH